MQISAIATLFRFSPFRFGHRFVQREQPRERIQPLASPDDHALTRQADQRLVRELGLWETFLHGGEKPTIRR